MYNGGGLGGGMSSAAPPTGGGLTGPRGPAGADGHDGVDGGIGPAAFVPRGTYSNVTAYIAGDVVAYSGSSYYCILASTGNGNPNTDTTHWQYLATAGAPGVDGVDGAPGAVGADGLGYRNLGLYNAGTTYVVNDVVTDAFGSSWAARVTTTGNAVPVRPTMSNTQWTLVAFAGIDGTSFKYKGAWSGATAYAVNDVVVDTTGSDWISILAGTNHAVPVLPTTANTYWSLFTAKGLDGADYATGAVAGSVLYGSAAGVLSLLAPNTAVTHKYFRMIGTGSAGQAPAWTQIDYSEITGIVGIGYGGTGIDSSFLSQRLFFASPNSGSGSSSFRAILASDIPTLNQNTSGTAGGLSTPYAPTGDINCGVQALTGVSNAFTLLPAGAKRQRIASTTTSTMPNPGAGLFDGQTIHVDWTATGTETLAPAVGATNAFIFGSDFTVLPAGVAGKTYSFAAIWNTASLRWRLYPGVGGF